MSSTNLLSRALQSGDRHPLLAAALVCALASAILLPLHAWVDLVNVAMIMSLLVLRVLYVLFKSPTESRSAPTLEAAEPRSQEIVTV